MVKHIIALSIFTMIVLASCSNETKEIDTNSATNEVETVIRHADTTIDISPIQIGNDKGQIEVTGIRMYENNLLTHSHFYISLKDISSYHMNRFIDKQIIIDSNRYLHLKDSVNADYLPSAILKNIEFDFVRSNALYFDAILENVKDGKEIKGVFNLFYRTQKKGQVIGWITDEIIELTPSI